MSTSDDNDDPQNIQFANLLRSAVPISKETAVSMVFEEDVMCDSAKDRFVLIRESEKKPPLFFCTGTLSQINALPAAAIRARRPGVT